ncbi:MAG: hypothetical protein ACREBC_38345 [Pyrinomonadaceae bacterium]
MNNEKHWSAGGWHPSEKQLLLYVNGELGANLAGKVLAHLQGCWSCAMEHDRMAGAISAFMRGRQGALADSEFPERANRRFENKLQRLAFELEGKDWHPVGRCGASLKSMTISPSQN